MEHALAFSARAVWSLCSSARRWETAFGQRLRYLLSARRTSELAWTKHFGCYAIGLVLGLLAWVATAAVQKKAEDAIFVRVGSDGYGAVF
ncbi:MAG: hypothetical protein R3B54_07540 [Bdellovibrionota bacterium]